MADGTRFKTTEKVEQHLQQLHHATTSAQEQLIEIRQRQDEQHRLLQEHTQTILDMKRSSEELQIRVDQSTTEIGEWIRALSQKVDRKFNIEGAAFEHQEKTPSAGNREIPDETDAYRPPRMRNDGFLADQNRFPKALYTRFGEKQGVNIVEEFNRLCQSDGLEEYNEKFEELRAGMLSYNPHLPENYFVTSYIGGLKPEIKPLVKWGRPRDLAESLELARLQWNAMQAIVRIKTPWKATDTGEIAITTSLVQEMQKEPDGSEDLASIEVTDDDYSVKSLREIQIVQEEIKDCPLQLGESGLEFKVDDDPIELLQIEVVPAIPIEEMNKEIEEISENLQVQSNSSVAEQLKTSSNLKNSGDIEEPQNQHNGFKVNSEPIEFISYGIASKKVVELVKLLIELMEIRLTKSKVNRVGFRLNSTEGLRNFSADKVLEKMPHKSGMLCDQFGYNIVDGEISTSSKMEGKAFLWPFDRGKGTLSIDNGQVLQFTMEGVFGDLQMSIRQHLIFKPYEKGKMSLMSLRPWVEKVQSECVGRGIGWVFDPGGNEELLVTSVTAWGLLLWADQGLYLQVQGVAIVGDKISSSFYSLLVLDSKSSNQWVYFAVAASTPTMGHFCWCSRGVG